MCPPAANRSTLSAGGYNQDGEKPVYQFVMGKGIYRKANLDAMYSSHKKFLAGVPFTTDLACKTVERHWDSIRSHHNYCMVYGDRAVCSHKILQMKRTPLLYPHLPRQHQGSHRRTGFQALCFNFIHNHTPSLQLLHLLNVGGNHEDSNPSLQQHLNHLLCNYTDAVNIHSSKWSDTDQHPGCEQQPFTEYRPICDL